MGAVEWGDDIAAAYDRTSAVMFSPEVLDPAVDLLAELAGDGPALELAIGTGRVALPLRARGIAVHGIELSAPMVSQLRQKPGGADVPVTIGDMASAPAPPPGGPYRLVYLVWNALMNLTTQREQVDTFRNAAAHLAPGGRFVVEIGVPRPGPERVWDRQEDHIGIETYDDLVGQIASSHHWWVVDGQLLHHSAPYRYVWPSELDLMGELARLRLEARWADWLQSGFSSESDGQVAVYRL
jgi:SAM-dependent methyltransferase